MILSAAEFPYLADHRIGQTSVFPGTGYLEAALAMFPDDVPCFLQDVVFHRPLAVPPHAITTLRTGYDPEQRVVTMHSRGQDDDADWTAHARMRRAELIHPRLPGPRTTPLAELTRSLPACDHDEVYAWLDGSGLDYGPAFRAVDRLWCRADTSEVFAQIRTDTVDAAGYRLHPAWLDGALQAMIAGSARMAGVPQAAYVPARIAEFRFYRSPGQQLWLHGRDRRSPVAGRLEYDLTLVTDDGAVVAEVIGLRAQQLAAEDAEPDVEPQRWYYRSVWRPEAAEPPATPPAPGSWSARPRYAGTWPANWANRAVW